MATTPTAATSHTAQPTMAADTSTVTEGNEEIFEATQEVDEDAAVDIPAVNGDALLAAVLDIDTDEETDDCGDGEDEVVAERLDAAITSGTSLQGDEINRDGEISEDPAAPFATRQLVNTEMSEYEKFTPHPTDPTKINATFRMRMPDDSGWYVQKDVIPEVRQSAEEDKYDDEDSIFPLSLQASKVPRKFKAKRDGSEPRWVNTTGHRWERTVEGRTEVFYVKTVHRRFDARTHQYVQIFSSKSKLLGIDLNDKGWVYAYNKWIDQIIRRADSEYIQKKHRNHWTPDEISAMYTGFNTFFHTNGIDAYSRISATDLHTILDLVNAAGNNDRGIDALKGQMNSSHGGKNKSLAYLRDNLPQFEEYIEAGGVISRDERYPKQWIPQDEFPTAPRPNVRRDDGTPVTSGGRKPKSIAVGTQTDAEM